VEFSKVRDCAQNRFELWFDLVCHLDSFLCFPVNDSLAS
jgi:hypothetical protein